jgi:two-component system, NarL family, nitrate/nitrite response regulator NarL
MTQRIRILLVDDHTVVRDGLSACFQSEDHIEIAGHAENGREAIEQYRKLLPDVVLMDVAMPEMDGSEATAILKKEFPQAGVLMLSMHDEPEYVLRLMQAGATGYVLKDASFDELLKAVETVYQGNTYFSAGASKGLLASLSSPEPDGAPLSPRENHVLGLVADGLCNKEIARSLDISVRTVETHRQNIKKKLDIRTTAGLTKYAIEKGLANINS